MLIAAIDPVAEAKLDGLNKALVSGRYLTEHERGAGPHCRSWRPPPAAWTSSRRPRCNSSRTPQAGHERWLGERAARGSRPHAGHRRTTAQQAYNAVLGTRNGFREIYTGTTCRILVRRSGLLPAKRKRECSHRAGGQPPVGLVHRQPGFGGYG